MKVGTDGVLLGAWASTEKVKRALDVGTGTGLIALMLAQRSSAKVDAIEIEEDAVLQARNNFLNSPWKDRLQVYHTSLQDFSSFDKEYDLIVSNPPYFSVSSLTPPYRRAIARHTDKLSPGDLIACTTKFLAKNGRFAIIYPVNEFNFFLETASDYNLFMSRYTEVLPTPQKPAKRILAEFSFQKSPFEKNTIVIERNGRHQFSEEYKSLTEDFYLNF